MLPHFLIAWKILNYISLPNLAAHLLDDESCDSLKRMNGALHEREGRRKRIHHGKDSLPVLNVPMDFSVI